MNIFKVLKIETIAGQWALADKSMIGASGLSDGDIETGGPIPLLGKTFSSLFYNQHFQIFTLGPERLFVLRNITGG
jgi:hypothetical protein